MDRIEVKGTDVLPLILSEGWDSKNGPSFSIVSIYVHVTKIYDPFLSIVVVVLVVAPVVIIIMIKPLN